MRHDNIIIGIIDIERLACLRLIASIHSGPGSNPFIEKNTRVFEISAKPIWRPANVGDSALLNRM